MTKHGMEDVSASLKDDYYEPDSTRHDSSLSTSTRKESVRSGSRRAAKKRKKERASTARAALQQQRHAAALEAAPTSDETVSELAVLVTQLLEEMDTITREFHLMRLTFTLDDEVVHRAWYQSRVPTSFSSSSSSSSSSSFSSPSSSSSITTSSSSSFSSSSSSGSRKTQGSVEICSRDDPVTAPLSSVQAFYHSKCPSATHAFEYLRGAAARFAESF